METGIQIIWFLNENGWIGIAATIAVFIITLLITHRHKRPYLRYAINTIISGSASTLTGLEVSYLGSKIENLQRIRLLFWNAGRSPILKEDIPEKDRIHFMANGNFVILAATVISTTRESIGAKVSHEKEAVFLDVDNLDYGDGLLLEIFVEGEANSVEARGKIIGAKKIGRINRLFLRLVEKPDHYVLDYIERSGHSLRFSRL
jgi:hypothetical protein